MVLYLVRHGRPILDPTVPASMWVLDAEHEHQVAELAAQAPWPDDAVWFTSPEPKAARTAFLLTGRDVPVVEELREQERADTGWMPDFADVVREAFAHPRSAARRGWEPIGRTRSRVVDAVGQIVAEHPGRDVVLVGHGTAWTLLAAELTGAEPDLERWRALAMPDVITVAKTTLLRPSRDASAETWHEHLWDRLAASARRHEQWAVPLVDRLRDDPLIGALFPVFSHSVLHLRTTPRHDDDARLVAMVHSTRDGQYAALAPVEGEVFGAWGGFIPWPRYPDVAATVGALHEGLATRESRRPVVHEWSLQDAGGDTVARLVARAIDVPGFLGTMIMEKPHPLAQAVSAARALPLARPELVDIPETWNQVDPAALSALSARSVTGHDLGAITMRVHENQVWWVATGSGPRTT